MAQRPRQAAEVVHLSGDDIAEEIKAGRSVGVAAPVATPAVKVIDLSDRPKVCFAIGFGGGGKTTFMRWATGEVLARRSKARLVAIDPENRELPDYYASVIQPPTHEPAGIAAWLKGLLDVVMKEKTSALIDCGDGDTALGTVIGRAGDMVATMEREGVTPVAIYPMSPRVSDLSPLATLEAAGFQPKATLLILNEGRADPTVSREQAFRQIMRHSAFRAAVDRGAAVAWMPRLFVAKEATDGVVPEGRKVASLGMFDRSSIHKWLLHMTAVFESYASWLP